LWQLQSVLSELADRERQMSVKPESFAVVDREFQEANEEVTRITDSLEQIAKERRKVDGELSDQQELLKKYQGTLMQVKNQQQYAAAWKEIDVARKQAKELEDAIMKMMGDSEGLQAQLDENRAGFDDLKARHDLAYEEWQNSLGELRKESADLRKKADAIEATIAPRLLLEFKKVFSQRQGIAVARVNGDSCSACRTRVRPALMQQLKRGEMVGCEGCHRILYVETPSS
jgi:predicted  nucleic acid-binding Zn-ribbon protein